VRALAFCSVMTTSARFLALLNFALDVAASMGEQHVRANTVRLTTRHFTLGAMMRCASADQLALGCNQAINGGFGAKAD
jgi:hypothetical protein